jgi:hypothetical protein
MCEQLGYPNTQIAIRKKGKAEFYTALIEQRIPFMIVVFDARNPPATAMVRVGSFDIKNNITPDQNIQLANTFYNWMKTTNKSMPDIDPSNLRFYLIPGINTTDDIDKSVDQIGNTLTSLIIHVPEDVRRAIDTAIASAAEKKREINIIPSGPAAETKRVKNTITSEPAAAFTIGTAAAASPAFTIGTAAAASPAFTIGTASPAPAAPPRRGTRTKKGTGGKSKKNKRTKGTKRRNKKGKSKTRKYKNN